MSKVYLAEVYDYFLSNISDYTFLNKSNFEIEEDLFTYFKKARSRFYKCRNRLDLLEDDNGEQYFGYKNSNNEIVNTQITDYEINVLAHLMLVEYMRPIIASTEVLKQSLSDKDFRIYSQANQLRELNSLYRQFNRESKKMITEYSYMGMTDYDKK